MTVNERAEKAVEYKHKGCNCCQAVVSALADLTDADVKTLQKLSSGFGAGMGCMEGTCGALCGAVIMAGLLKDGKGTPSASRAILNDFQKRCGATICKDLKKRTNGKPLCECDDCVRNAVYAIDDTLHLPE